MKSDSCSKNILQQSTVYQIDKSGRLHHLDALRGLACVSVALCHSISVFVIKAPVDFFTGRLPVIFFFLLSGFVLSRSLNKENGLTKKGIIAYYIRRVFRLYPAAVASIIIGALAAKFLYAQPQEWWPCTEWLKKILLESKSITTLTDYIYSLALQNQALNVVLWTIQVELFCSLFFPLMILFVKRGPLLSILLMFFLSAMLWKYPNSLKGWIKFSNIIGFLLPFYLGYIISENIDYINFITKNQTKVLFAIFSVLIAICTRHWDTVSATFVLAGVLAILVPCNSLRLRNFLESAPLGILGKISYSFYLFHMLILFIIWTALIKWFPKFLCMQPHLLVSLFMFLFSVAVTIPLAALSERLVEQPFNKIGHRLSQFWIQKT